MMNRVLARCSGSESRCAFVIVLTDVLAVFSTKCLWYKSNAGRSPQTGENGRKEASSWIERALLYVCKLWSKLEDDIERVLINLLLVSAPEVMTCGDKQIKRTDLYTRIEWWLNTCTLLIPEGLRIRFQLKISVFFLSFAESNALAFPLMLIWRRFTIDLDLTIFLKADDVSLAHLVLGANDLYTEHM